MLDMKELLAFAVEQNASDVHLACGIPPKLRINGKLTEVEVPPLTPADAAEAIGSTMFICCSGDGTFPCKCIYG